jgi:hypothetical protein
MRPSDEWKKMMLTEGIKLNVLDENDLARIRLKNGIVDDFVEVLSVPLREKFQGARRAIRSAPQTFSIQVLAKAIKQVAICIYESGKIFLRKAIALARESFFEIKIGIAALNHRLCG